MGSFHSSMHPSVNIFIYHIHRHFHSSFLSRSDLFCQDYSKSSPAAQANRAHRTMAPKPAAPQTPLRPTSSHQGLGSSPKLTVLDIDSQASTCPPPNDAVPQGPPANNAVQQGSNEGSAPPTSAKEEKSAAFAKKLKFTNNVWIAGPLRPGTAWTPTGKLTS